MPWTWGPSPTSAAALLGGIALGLATVKFPGHVSLGIYLPAAANLAAESKERREVESRLRMSQMEYQNVLENMEDTYYRTTITGAILYTSPSVHRLLGYTREELVGINMGTLYSDDNSRDKFLKDLSASGGAVRNYEVHLRC